jgi:hypothetical protein
LNGSFHRFFARDKKNFPEEKNVRHEIVGQATYRVSNSKLYYLRYRWMSLKTFCRVIRRFIVGSDWWDSQ